MVTLGIDISSQPKGTAACAISWGSGRAIAANPQLSCNDETLTELIADADAVGIDAPFGWPSDFTAAVAEWTIDSWNGDVRKQLCFRTTDRVVRETVGRWPLSVSADKLALPAMRTFALLFRHGVTNRSGDGKFFEVYPAGSLRQWKLASGGYKDATLEHQLVREAILNSLREAMPWLTAPDSCAATGDALDALVASLTARAAMQGRTLPPTVEQSETAKREGWIHLPSDFPTAVSAA
jgi:predicted nuclease with RNAse H fold